MPLSSAEQTELSDELRRLARILVGRVSLTSALRYLRAEMSSEALARTKGSRRAAAFMLGVDRRYVQRLAQELAQSPDDTLQSELGRKASGDTSWSSHQR